VSTAHVLDIITYVLDKKEDQIQLVYWHAVRLKATEDVQTGVTQEDVDVFYEVWSQFDPKATEYIPVDQLGEFVDQLDAPLRLPAPNTIKLITLDIRIYDGDVVNCVDVLDALTKNTLGTAAEGAEDLSELLFWRRRSRQVAGTTLERRRQQYCATLIQVAWRRHVERRRAARKQSTTSFCSIILEEPDDE